MHHTCFVFCLILFKKSDGGYDEYTRECLALVVERRLRSDDVLHCLTNLFVTHGTPEHIRSDNGPEFTAKAVRQWLEK